MSEMSNKKSLVAVGNCPQGKGIVTSRNSEKCQRCVRESFPKGEIMERRPLPQDTKEYFDLRLMENKLKDPRARVSTKNMRIGG
jgi:hypothetical protein